MPARKSKGEMTPEETRLQIREEKLTGPTPGYAGGYAQANLLIIPEEYAFEFSLFAFRNPKPCPVLDILEKGQYSPPSSPEADIRTDLPRYRLYKEGKLIEETLNIRNFWQDNLVSFLLGCSFTFESALQEENIPIRHIENNKNVPMYITNIKCHSAGIFSGPMVVSMRPLPGKYISRAVEITSKYPEVHGAPVHIGAPQEIGIDNIDEPDFGEKVSIKKNEIPVFWACGVTPQAVVMESKLPFVITHSPGHMFITDIRNRDLKEI